MKFWVGVTDNNWYSFLSRLQPDEVNFWQPGGTTVFRALTPGELFLFKLRAPDNAIAGGGFFVKHSFLPVSLAWEAFEVKNGAAGFDALRNKILSLRHGDVRAEPDPTIGCIILAQPFFLKPEEWIPVPEDWAPNIVQGKRYYTEDQIGKSLFANVQERLIRYEVINKTDSLIAEEQPRYGAEYIAKSRLGQGAFRVLVTDAYGRRCAMTGEKTLPVLESAHIKPYAFSGPHSVSNGLLLRSDLHKLFDIGYITITGDFHIEVSKRIKEKYENGRDYYALHGRLLQNLPKDDLCRPAVEYINWHNTEIFIP